MAGAELRVGVIGTGRWANMAHLPGWTRDSRVDLVAVCDVDGERAAEAAQAFGVPESTTDHRRMLERDDIDLIDVCTPRQRRISSWPWRRSKPASTCSCEKPVAYDFRDTLRARDLARRKGLKTKVGSHLPLQPGRALHARAHRRGLHRHAVHLQRLRAELAVARSADAAAPGATRRRPGPDPGVVARGLRRADHRPRPPGSWAPTSRRSSARMRNFIPERMVRATGPHDAHEHRRRRHLHGRVRERRALLDSDELRDGRQLPGHRGARVRQQGRAHLPARRGIRRLRDAQGGDGRRRRIQELEMPRALLPGRRQRARDRGGRSSTRTSSPASSPRS